ncbi:TetR/AcrR family transcriptional regulator [Labrenzia sp. ac12]
MSRYTLHVMVYPSKIDRKKIVETALELLSQEGEAALTLRRVAREIGVTPNALYRLFESHDVLLAAVADAVAEQLLLAIEGGAVQGSPKVQLRGLLSAYAAFAENNPDQYRVLLSANEEAWADLPEPHFHARLWDRCLQIVVPLVGADAAPDATVTLWGLLHGIWTLRQAGVLGGRKPTEIYEYAFDALIDGLKPRPVADFSN